MREGASELERRSWSSATVAGLASLGAGAVHAAAVGLHADEPTLARLFVALAAAQLAVGLAMLVRGGRAAAALTALVNAAAVAAWATSRLAGIAWIPGLEQAEPAGFADTACAALGLVAVSGALVSLLAGRTRAVPTTRLGLPAGAVGVVTVVAMVVATTDTHSHADRALAASAPDGHVHDAAPAAGEPSAVAVPTTHAADGHHHATTTQVEDTSSNGPPSTETPPRPTTRPSRSTSPVSPA